MLYDDLSWGQGCWLYTSKKNPNWNEYHVTKTLLCFQTMANQL